VRVDRVRLADLAHTIALAEDDRTVLDDNHREAGRLPILDSLRHVLVEAGQWTGLGGGARRRGQCRKRQQAGDGNE
jgi:hypothetical protein